MSDRLALPRRYREQLEALLSEHVPGVEVWAYGSRVNGESHDGSDLDLALRGPALEPLDGGYYDLLEAIEKSNIPILVQAHDWAMQPESFHREIELDYVVVQEGVGKQTTAGEWCEVTLSDLIDIKHGFAFKGSSIHDDPQGDILLTPGNFAIGGGFKGDKFKYYDGPIPEEFVLGEGDLLVSMTDLSKQSDTLGYPALVPSRPDGRRYLHNQRLGKISLKETGEAFARYIYYLLCSTEYRSEVLASATGTTVKHTSPERIKQFRFILPPLSEQRAIAHILGALDDKIELNRRMNETLEAMARALFKSWFVDFEPVRAKMEGRWRRGESLPGLPAEHYDLFPDRLVDSELGEVPEGWEVKGLGEVALQRRSGVKPEEIDAESPYIALEHMPKRCIALRQWSNADGLASGKFKFEQGDILFGKLRPYFHKVGVAPLDGVCSTDIVVVQPKSNLWFGFVLGHTSSAEFVDYTDATSTGTRMPRTNWTDMARYRVALPSIAVSKAFTRLVEPYVNRIVSAIHESHSLAAQRDALLPRLVSGKVGVEDANEPLHAVKE